MVKFTISLLLLFCLVISASAQEINKINLSDTIPFDDQVKKGRLPNGLSYYIKRNLLPKNKVVLDFIVKAGKLQQESDQRELAHLLEHMPFAGTENFPNARDHFGKSGVKWGNDINAFTRTNYTDYYLCLSANDQLISDGLLFFRDISNRITLNPKEIDQERSVVLAEGGVVDKYKEKLIENAEYTSMIVKYDGENLKQFKHETLIRFYKDWYRPDLEAVIVVGDIDVDKIEHLINELFSDLRNEGKKKTIVSYKAPENWNSDFTKIIDSDHGMCIDIYANQPYKLPVIFYDYKMQLAEELYNSMVASRLNDLRQQYEPPISSASSMIRHRYPAPFIRTLNTHIDFSNGRIEEGFKSVMIELERVKKFGFSSDELVTAKQNILHRASIYLKHSNDIVNELTEHFVNGAVVPNPEKIKMINEFILKGIMLQDIKKIIEDWNKIDNRDIVFVGPDSLKYLVPDETTVVKWLEEIKSEKIQPFIPRIDLSGKHLINPGHFPVVSNTSYKQKTIESIDATELIMSNGIKVLLKPTTNNVENGKIYVKAINPKGIKQYSGTDLFLSTRVAAMVRQSGLGPFNFFELKKYLNDNGVTEVTPYMSGNKQGIQGIASSRSTEILFQAIYEYLINPKIDDWPFQNSVDIERARLREAENKSKSTKLLDISTEQLNGISKERAYEVYKELFENLGDFTFVITGNFETDVIKPIILKYVGSLSSIVSSKIGNDCSPEQVKARLNKGISVDSTQEMHDVSIVFSGLYKYGSKKNVEIDFLMALLNERIIYRLRQIEGGSYTPSAGGSRRKRCEGEYDFSISFSCTPDRVQHLTSCAFEEIELLKKGLIRDDQFQTIKNLKLKELGERNQDSQRWCDYLATQIQNRERLGEIIEYEAYLKKITKSDVKKAANEFLQ